MTNVGFATLSVIPSFDGFQNRLERGVTPGLTNVGRTSGVRFGDAAGRSAGQRFGSAFRTAARVGAVGALAAIAGAVKLGADSITLASDQQESINAVNVAYGKQGRAVQRLGKQSAKSLALPRKEFNELAVRFSNFANTIAGGDGKKTIKTLDDLTKRGADFASVYNLEAAEALTLFQSGLAGETEPLRRFGIDMSAARVEAFAYAEGIAEAGAKLTESEKVQARYRILMQETAKTQGDLANTSDSLANRQKFLNARWDDAQAKLGKGLLPIVEDAVGFILDHGIPAFEDFSDWFNEDGIPAIRDLGKKLRPLADELLPAARDGFKAIKGFAQDALPFAEGIVKAFNDMPDWVKKALVGGAVGGFAAKKLGLGGVGSSLLERGGSPARPLYVFTVNGGGGPGGVGGKVGLLGFLGQAGFAAAASAAATIGIVKAHEATGSGVKPPAGGDSAGGFTGGFLAGKFDEDRAKLKIIQREVGEVQGKWIDSKAAANDYNIFVRNRLPGEIKFTVLGWPVAQQQAREYLSLLLQIRQQHMDQRLDMSGGTPLTRGSGGGKGGGSTGRVIAVSQTFNVNTIGDAEKYGQHRMRQISAGGFG